MESFKPLLDLALVIGDLHLHELVLRSIKVNNFNLVLVHSVCLPGREGRFKDSFATDWTHLIKELGDDIVNVLDSNINDINGSINGFNSDFENITYHLSSLA